MHMTGKELIIYILQNNLENEEVFNNQKFAIFMSEEEAAVALGVGTGAIRAMFEMGMLKGFAFNNSLFLLKNEGG
jgi:hypothetical protein